MKEYEDDGSWLWVAFSPEYRLIVAFVIGSRKQYFTDELLKLTAKRLSESRPLFVSDGLKFYTKALFIGHRLRLEMTILLLILYNLNILN